MKFVVRLVAAVASAAVLFALALAMGNVILGGNVMPAKVEAPKVIVAAPEAAPAGAVAAAAPAVPFDYATYKANPDNGAKIAGKCKTCHTFGSGEPNRVGPNNFGVVGKTVASVPGFAYSDAMKAKAGEVGTWTEEALFAFLENPKAYVPGTKMQFAGIASPEERADLIAWLKTMK